MRTKLLSTVAAVGGLLFLAGSAQALTVSIQMAEGGGGPLTEPATLVASGNGGASFVNSFGDFAVNQVIASGSQNNPVGPTGFPEPQPLLTTSTIDASNTCNGCTLTVMVTETGLTYPTPSAAFTLNPDWLAPAVGVATVDFSWYISNTDLPFATTTELTSFQTNATTNGLILPLVKENGITNPFSETLAYTITFDNCALVACSATLGSQMNAVVPEPASLSLLGGALIGFGAWRRRRKAA